ncbi:transposase domain protein [Geobacillus kaustophilus]|uniref:Transposase domain protein n=1 Tax=Geobacillus kaustophilus TaxID=1462 RepID=A0A0D8BQX3_GEOKU|nr:transposase domain protein [Geobacillus kaustophilus]
MGYLFLLALAIYRVFQRRVRPFITPECPLKGAGGRKLTRPTGQAIFQLFQYVNVVLFKLPDGHIQRSLDRSLTPEQRRILQGLGLDESIYVQRHTERPAMVKKGLPSLVVLVET